VKDVDDGRCYVIPVGSNRTAGHELRNFVKNYDGQEIDAQQQTTYRADVLPGAIEDTSFLPPDAKAACDSFHWLSIVGEGKKTVNYNQNGSH
jgi:hypothetical protein